MQDNAPPHHSDKLTKFFEENGITVLPWPPYSPDLNPNENVWGILKQTLRKEDLSDKEKAPDLMKEAFQNVGTGCILDMYVEYKERAKAVIENDGNATKY